MKYQLSLLVAAPAVALCVLASSPAQAAVDVGVSIGISQPGVYGRIDIGQFPQPQVILPQPMIIQPVYGRPAPQPVYLWVPPGHRKNWRKHCREYNACGVPVYFVQENWYRGHVAPPQGYRRDDDRHEHGWGDSHGEGHGRGKGRGHDD
jgi:hypothetical protein